MYSYDSMIYIYVYKGLIEHLMSLAKYICQYMSHMPIDFPLLNTSILTASLHFSQCCTSSALITHI